MPFGTCETQKQDKTIRISIRFIFLSFSTVKGKRVQDIF